MAGQRKHLVPAIFFLITNMGFDKDYKQIEKNESLNKMIYAFFKGYEVRFYLEPKNSEAPYPYNIAIAREFLRLFKLEGDIKPKEVCRRYVNFNLELEKYPFGC